MIFVSRVFCAAESADNDDGVYWKVTSLLDIAVVLIVG